MSTTRATELELHTPFGTVVQLLAVLQRPEAKHVGDLLRRTMLQYGRLDPSVEYGKMRVSKLRAVLRANDIPCRLCAEKGDFVRAIHEAIEERKKRDEL